VTPIHEILSAEEIARIRSGYAAGAEQLTTYVDRQFGKLHPAAMPLFDQVSAQLFGYEQPDRRPAAAISERDRERCIIAILASKGQHGVPLAVHFYWGLAAGLEPQEIADTLLVVAVYAGFDAYTTGLGLLARTLVSLKRLATTDAVTPLHAVASLREM
jgi:alkylhydroperoxidase/carboxymuconolactone decarboxylase family protein YurZ